MIRKFAAIFLLVLWLGVIFSFSNASGETSGGMSEKLIKNVVSTFSNIDKDSESMQKIVKHYSFVVRKSAHFVEYFILGIIVVNFFVSFNINKRILIYSSIFCIVAALFDEIHQTFVHSRNGNLVDVLLDSSASLIASYLVVRFYLFRGMYEKKHN